MSFKVQVGPAQIAIHQGQTVLLTETDGRVSWPSKCGLYFRDTRLISAWAIYANLDHFGEQPSKHANRVYGDGQCARKKS